MAHVAEEQRHVALEAERRACRVARVTAAIELRVERMRHAAARRAGLEAVEIRARPNRS
jgi:hypothetical protein